MVYRDSSLHEFMAKNKTEIHRRCVGRMKSVSPARTEKELVGGLATVIDEVLAALQREAGLPVESALPGRSSAAGNHGAARQQHGFPIANVALDFGSICDVLGEIGAEQGRSFRAREYQVFNQCIDTAIASGVEQFWSRARKQMDDANTERLGFLGHELRNTLGSARMAFESLKRGEVGVHGRVGQVLDRSLGRLESLVNQTLLAVQIHGGLEPQPRRIVVRQLFQDLEDAAVLERNIRIVVECDDRTEVDADEGLVVSAMSNLIQNAVKFTRQGGLIVLRARCEGAAVVLQVEDECGGLPPGRPQDLFAPFVRRGTDGRGLGLGLSITKEAVEAHGGTITVEDLPGKGCVFGVRLPRGPALP